MDQDPDRALIRELSSDDDATRRRALGALYDRYHGRVFGIAYRVLGSAADAADVTQEVFLQVGDRIGGFRGDASLTSWLYRVTLNLAIDARRKRLRRPAQSLSAATGETEADVSEGRPGTAAPPEDPAAASLRAEREHRVREALDRLSPKLRAVAVLRYFENLSYDELAEVLDTSIGTVKSRLNRAHAALERLLR
ncbi:MAG: sigma-70 family RNA polymerase sigma factor [Planctomycetes bacterium]|nr:sigma-70 family RNA polymerase sigma factor [Planctomycetota bacterium]